MAAPYRYGLVTALNAYLLRAAPYYDFRDIFEVLYIGLCRSSHFRLVEIGFLHRHVGGGTYWTSWEGGPYHKDQILALYIERHTRVLKGGTGLQSCLKRFVSLLLNA